MFNTSNPADVQNVGFTMFYPSAHDRWFASGKKKLPIVVPKLRA
jgi:hypothetical protein